jgi:hypothetical protein
MIGEGDRLVIINDDQAWMVSKSLGLKEVLCDVQEVDEFEAMRRYIRTMHARKNRVKVGKMFRQMVKSGGLSRRELARKMDVTETTVRNALLYVEAAEVRDDYAPGRGESDISPLSKQQVRTYLKKLSAETRDAWLDAGADLKAVPAAANDNSDAAGDLGGDEQPTSD